MKKIILISILFNSFLLAQELSNYNLSGSLINDTRIVNQEISKPESVSKIDFMSHKKTPMLAALMSFAVPGAGEVYTENYLKAGIFAAVEVTAIVFAVTYNNKGDKQTDFFQNYANEHWSADQYAKWTYNHLDQLNPNLSQSDYNNLFNSNGKLSWEILNKMEGDIGSYYSHRLAPYGDQQYYEMIGKYSQFNVGWDEFGDENTDYFYNPANPTTIPQFHWYSKERGKANDYYTVAKWAVIAVVSNHFLSAFDAAWSASKYNKRINLSVSVKEDQIGFTKEYYPQLNLKINL